MGGDMTALVRVVHASPDAPAVDVGPISEDKVDAIEAYSGLSFRGASMGAGTELPVGELTVGVAAAGTDTPVATFDVATYAGLRAFAVACGSLTPEGDEESFRLVLVLTDGMTWAAAEVMPNM